MTFITEIDSENSISSLPDDIAKFALMMNSNPKKLANYIGSAMWLIVVACLWGATNPYIKKGSKGIENIKRKTRFAQLRAELKFLATNVKYLVPFLINQSGSVIYYITLASAELSLAVPITNSLTFIFTSISGRLLGEKIASAKTYAGMVLVLTGVLLCVLGKV